VLKKKKTLIFSAIRNIALHVAVTREAHLHTALILRRSNVNIRRMCA